MIPRSLESKKVFSASYVTSYVSIERFQSRGQHLSKLIRTKESVYIKKEFNSHRIGLEHQHGRSFIVWNTN